MKTCRFKGRKLPRIGILRGNYLEPLPSPPSFLAPYEPWFGRVALEDVVLLPPVDPPLLLCLGWNYPKHVDELGDKLPQKPAVFSKSVTSVIGPEEEIKLPNNVGQIDYEGELAFIVKDYCRNVKKDEAYSHIFGYTLLNDVTAREIELREIEQGLPWFVSKSFDTFAPMGPCILTSDEVSDPHSFVLQLYLNGEKKQESSLDRMFFKIPDILSYISSFMTIPPGTVISTGTPPGVGSLKEGDVVEVYIQEIGRLRNRVVGSDSDL